MSKLVRFDEDHFGYLAAPPMSAEQAHQIMLRFEKVWPGKSLLVFQADEFIDLTGQYQIVPIEMLEG